MPTLGGATEWVTSDPLGPAELRGHGVLVNFWTLTCINRLRQEPYVRAWSQAYRDDGLHVVGLHTPGFSLEHDIELRPEPSPPYRPHGLQLHVVDGGWVADCHGPGRLSVPVVVVT
jgi:thiol-disulfide isomerase/thioredoxin